MSKIEYEFGNFQETYDWIECESISYPRKIYYNLRIRFSSWSRPNQVAKHVQLQRYRRYSKTYNNNKFSPDIDVSLVVLSSEDEEIGENYNTSKQRFINKKHVKKIIYENSNNNDNKYFDDNKNYISMIISENDKQSPTKDDKPILPVLNIQNATAGCLQGKKVQKERMQQDLAQQMQLKESKLNESKIAYELYDTRTVNYDFKPIFLPEIKITRLSDTSTISLLFRIILEFLMQVRVLI